MIFEVVILILEMKIAEDRWKALKNRNGKHCSIKMMLKHMTKLQNVGYWPVNYLDTSQRSGKAF